MRFNIAEIISRADRLVDKVGTRDPRILTQECGIHIIEESFERQKGAYFVLNRIPFILLKNDMEYNMKQLVLYHELGHHMLHREYATANGGFQEFNLFNMKTDRMEYEANIYAAQTSLSDEEVLDYIGSGYDLQQIAMAMNSDTNLVALKIDALIAQGFFLRRQDHKSTFLAK